LCTEFDPEKTNNCHLKPVLLLLESSPTKGKKAVPAGSGVRIPNGIPLPRGSIYVVAPPLFGIQSLLPPAPPKKPIKRYSAAFELAQAANGGGGGTSGETAAAKRKYERLPKTEEAREQLKLERRLLKQERRKFVQQQRRQARELLRLQNELLETAGTGNATVPSIAVPVPGQQNSDGKVPAQAAQRHPNM
jgi:hypothetical protein